MNVTLSLDDELVRKVRKVAAQNAATGRKRRERETLDRSFERLQFKVGKRAWTRADLHERS